VEGNSTKTVSNKPQTGEPINPEAWKWYYEVVGEKKCAIVDTYWQTETYVCFLKASNFDLLELLNDRGGVICTPLPGATPTKPGMNFSRRL